MLINYNYIYLKNTRLTLEWPKRKYESVGKILKLV